MGYNVCADGCSRFDIELGRRPLYTVFDSRVQFQNRFDGLLLKYYRNFDCWGDFYWYVGAFVVDERAEHFAWITEVGLTNIYDCGIDFRYSYIDWKSLVRHDQNRCGTRNPLGFDYQVSQWTLSYQFNPEYLCQPTKLYGAFLWNSAAHKVDRSIFGETSVAGDRFSANIAWYAGFIIGEVCREGDWSLDINYQYVELFAIPDADAGGIGGGTNLLGQTATSAGRGFTNYKGWRFEGLYALTDNLSLDASFEFSQQINARVAGKHSYNKFELSAIYAF